MEIPFSDWQPEVSVPRSGLLVCRPFNMQYGGKSRENRFSPAIGIIGLSTGGNQYISLGLEEFQSRDRDYWFVDSLTVTVK